MDNGGQSVLHSCCTHGNVMFLVVCISNLLKACKTLFTGLTHPDRDPRPQIRQAFVLQILNVLLYSQSYLHRFL